MRRTVTENNRTILNIRTEKKVTNYFKLVIGETDIPTVAYKGRIDFLVAS